MIGAKKNKDFNLEIYSLWNSLSRAEISKLLIEEYKLYSKMLQANDDPMEYIKFYSHYEPLCELAADKTCEQLEEGKISLDKNQEIQTSKISSELKSIKKLVIYIGDIGLAHGCLLKGHIASLPQKMRNTIIIAFTSLDSQKVRQLSNDYGIKAFSVNDYIQGLKRKYIHLAELIATLNGKQEVIWWGMPLGMVFTLSLSRKIQNSLKGSKPIHSFYSSKYKYSFSSRYIDKLYDGTPKNPGYYSNENRSIYAPALFDQADIEPKKNMSNALSNKVKGIQSLLNKTDGPILSGFSRPQKICSDSYLDAIKKIIDALPNARYLVFGLDKSLINYYFGVKYKGNIINIEWLNYKAIPHLIGCIDLFVDPFPFGAGFTLIIAAMQGIPIVSSRTNISEYPGINNSVFNDILDQHRSCPNLKTEILLEKMMGKAETYVERSLSLLNNKDYSRQLSIAQREFFVNNYFNRPTKSILYN